MDIDTVLLSLMVDIGKVTGVDSRIYNECRTKFENYLKGKPANVHFDDCVTTGDVVGPCRCHYHCAVLPKRLLKKFLDTYYHNLCPWLVNP